MNTTLSTFVGFGNKNSRSLANLFRHPCQNYFSPVQQTIRGKIISVKSVQFCPTFGALSWKKDRSLANSMQHSLSFFHFSCPANTLKKNDFVEKCTKLLISVGFEQKKDLHSEKNLEVGVSKVHSLCLEGQFDDKIFSKNL